MTTLQENLIKRGFAFSHFATVEEASAYLDQTIDRTTVGMGGSITLTDMGIYDRLATHNEVFWHHRGGDQAKANQARIYLTSLNGVAETGELINIDGTGNRVAATLFGPERVYFVIGKNKVAPDFEQALWRARNIAAPKNAQRLGVKTPCAAKGDHCYNCQSPDRICRALVVFWEKPRAVNHAEVVLIDQDLGF